jgi:iron complex transport system substrate-binding protein
MTSTHVPCQEPSDVIDSYVREHLGNHEALYDLDVAQLADASPDVVVSQALCDVCAVATGDVVSAIQALPSRPALVDLEPNTLDEVLEDVLRVGSALEARDEARQLVTELTRRRDEVANRTATIAQGQRPRVAFLEWLIPPFNGGHWNPELVELAGGVDLLGAPGQPSSTQDWDTIVEAQPDVIFIACCGFDTERTMEDIAELSKTDAWQGLPAARDGLIFVADGDYFSCPGPRLLDGLDILAHALHPTAHPAPSSGAARQVGA